MAIKLPPKSSPRRFFESVAWGILFALTLYGITILSKRFLKTQIGAVIVKLLSVNVVFLFYLLIYIFIICGALLVIIVHWMGWENIRFKFRQYRYRSSLVVKDYYKEYKRFAKTAQAISGLMAQAPEGEKRLDLTGGFDDSSLVVDKGYYPDGVLKTVVSYKDGKLHGVFRSYYCSGKIEQEIYYRDGKMDGPFLTFYENGNPHNEKNYHQGRLNGLCRAWDESGSLFFEVQYKDDVQEGFDKTYYQNGAVQYEDTYHGGRRVRRKTFDESGVLLFDHKFEDNPQGMPE